MVKLDRMVKFLFCSGLIIFFLVCTATHKYDNIGQYVDDSVI